MEKRLNHFSGIDANRNYKHYVERDSKKIDEAPGNPEWRERWKAFGVIHHLDRLHRLRIAAAQPLWVGLDKLKTGVSMAHDHIERRENGFYIVGSRVPIDRIVWEYPNGEDPAAIQSHYPTLSLDQVDGALAFYRSHKDEVDRAIAERKLAEDAYIAAHPAPPEVKEKFERMRRQMASPRS